MLQTQVIILAISLVYNICIIYKPELNYGKIILVLCIAFLFYSGILIFQLKFMQIITSLVMIFLGYLIGSTIKRFNIVLFLIAAGIFAVALLFNGGLTKRIYDEAGILSFADEYNVNHNLKYTQKLSIPDSYSEVKVYIMTQKIDGDMKKENKVKEKFKHKDNVFMIFLNYDEDNNYVGTGYYYNAVWWFTFNDDKKALANVTSCMNQKGLVGNEKELVSYIQASVGTHDQEMFDNDDPGTSDPGVHGVDGYTRQDGTQVDGYLRTNPDGDPTNNFSYPY